MIWQWTGKSLVAMRAVQQGLLVGWICHTFDVKMSFSPKKGLVKLNTALWLPHFHFGRQHRLDVSNMSWKHLTPSIFVFFAFLSAFHLCTLQSTKNGWSAKYTPCNKLMAIFTRQKDNICIESTLDCILGGSSGNIMGSTCTVARYQYICGTTQWLLFF